MPTPPASSHSAVPVLTHWEAYATQAVAAGQLPGLASFGHYLLRVAGEGTALPALPAELHNNTQYARIRLPDRVALLVWRLSRFMRLSFKRHFGGSALQSIDEFSMLAGLRFLERPTKTQLFHFELLETTTGLQMAARLQRAGLLSEAPHPTDGRQKCLALSPTGQATLATAADTMDFIADELVGMLPDADLVLLEQMLAGINRVLTAARKT